jgi:general secretion pathway protein K
MRGRRILRTAALERRGAAVMSAPQRQRGIALLIALLTVALATILIAGLLDRGELAFARTRNALRAEQAQAYAQGLEAYAAQVLLKDLGDDPGIDTNADIWAAPLPPQQVPGGVITASMQDLNGCFNLNNLAGDAGGTWFAMFGRLLEARGLDPTIATAVRDWLGTGDGSDVVDGYYLAQPVPYRSAQRAFVHVSELRLVRGVTRDAYARLAPYVCALPPGTKINVNTASVPVLQTLGPISQAQAESLWQNGQAHFGDVREFRQQCAQQLIEIDVPDAVLATSSGYFLARADIRLDGIPFTFYSLIDREHGLQVVERSRGGDAVMAPGVLSVETGSR